MSICLPQIKHRLLAAEVKTVGICLQAHYFPCLFQSSLVPLVASAFSSPPTLSLPLPLSRVGHGDKDRAPVPQAVVKPQVLTHLIEGFVIQEGAEPFPVSLSCCDNTDFTLNKIFNMRYTDYAFFHVKRSLTLRLVFNVTGCWTPQRQRFCPGWPLRERTSM